MVWRFHTGFISWHTPRSLVRGRGRHALIQRSRSLSLIADLLVSGVVRLDFVTSQDIVVVLVDVHEIMT